MHNALLVVQIVLAILMTIAILLQEKGSGMGEAIGGTGAGASFQTSKRGAEKVLGQITFVLILFFLAVSLVLNLV